MDNKTLENLANAIEQLNQQYDSTYTSPEAIEALTKTINSFNITISDWNILVTTLCNHGFTLRNLKDIMPKLLEHLNPRVHTCEQQIIPSAHNYRLSDLGFTNFDEVKNVDTIIWRNPTEVGLSDKFFIRPEDIIFVKQCQTSEKYNEKYNGHIVFTAISAGYYTHGGTSTPTLWSLSFDEHSTHAYLYFTKLEFTATNTWYSNSNSNLEATNVQDAIDELSRTLVNQETVFNIEDGTGTNAIQMKQDGDSGVFSFTDKNPNATEIDATLTGDITYGATGNFATVLGGKASAQGKRSMAQGTTTIAKGDYSHAEGNNSVALGVASHTEGTATTANGYSSHAEGHETQALASAAHAEGYRTIASGTQSHAEGNGSTASGTGSHATCNHTQASGPYSSTAGSETIAAYSDQFVVGRFNNNRVNTLFEVGNGEPTYRTNAFEVFDDGHAEVLVQGMQDRAVAIKAYVDEKASEIAELNNEITDLKNALYGSILAVEPQTYENVGVAVIDRANGYPVVSNQKAQLKSIKGKTIVVNQLAVVTNPSQSTNGVDKLYNESTDTFHINGTATANAWLLLCRSKLIANNKYLIKCKEIDKSVGFYYSSEYSIQGTSIITSTSDFNAADIHLVIKEGQTVDFDAYIKVINLTKCFGSGNEPTTIEEFNRLTMGFDFDTYNPGTIESTNITKIVVGGYNLFDGELEVGAIVNGVNNNAGNYGLRFFRSVDYIRVIGGETYTLYEAGLTINRTDIKGYTTKSLVFYDKDKNYISKVDKTVQIATWEVPSNAEYVRIVYQSNTNDYKVNGVPTNPQICFHLTGNGALNGVYKPYTPDINVNIQTGTLNGVGTAQDEITETELKKAIGVLDLGSLSWQYAGGNIFYAQLPNVKATDDYTKANILCSIYATVERSDLTSGTICISGTDVIIQDASCPDVPSLLSKISGEPLYYETTTPVITAEGFGEVLFDVQRGGTVATDSNGDVTLTHVVYKPIQ